MQFSNGSLLGRSSKNVAVLLSGGLDSAIMTADLLREGAKVYPLYIRCGLRWEAAELDHVRRFLKAISTLRLRKLTILDMPAGDLYGDHWSQNGNVPDADSPDEAVFLPGRNMLLLSKAMLWCHLHGVPTVALAVLATNPFPDATESFLSLFESMANEGMEGDVFIAYPYAELDKEEVILRGKDFPLALTFSCLAPVEGLHCGECNKCAERRWAFETAGIDDPTKYASIEVKSQFTE